MYIFFRAILLILIALVTFSYSYSQVNLFVSSNGTSSAKGTIEDPFNSLQIAIDNAAQQSGQQVFIYLRGGTYYLTSTIIVTATDFSPASLTIKPYRQEKVIISAGRRLQLTWGPYRNGIYKAKVPKGISFERLYINDTLQVLARYPNYDSAARVFHGTAADAISPERVKHWKNPEGGYVQALHAHEWGGFHYRINGADSQGNLQLEGGWQNNRPNKMHATYRFVENIFEELDTTGEWYLDKNNGILYYYPALSDRLKHSVIEVSNLKNSIELRGTSKSPLKNIKIEGFHFAHNERTFMDTKEPLLRSDWTIYRGGTLLLDGTEACKISDCIFEGIGGNAIMLSNYNKRDTISGCHIYNTGANAICFIGSTSAVRSPSFKYDQYISFDKMDKMPGPRTGDFPVNCIATDNLLHDLGEIEKQSTGVEIEIASSITVSHNSIYNTPRAGINIGDGCFGGHIIEYNDVFNTVRETGDHGSFNAWGRDRYWAPDRKYMDSLVKAYPWLITIDARKQTIIRNNRFRCDHGWDIDLDDGSSNYYIYNNLCLNGGIKLREGFYRRVENNIIINNSFHPHVWFNKSGDVFRKNIVMKKYAPIQIVEWGKQVDYNLFPDKSALAFSQANGTDSHSVFGDPVFIDPAHGDFRVAQSSPALTLGFQNFAMNNFGVQNPALKKLALLPQIPILITDPDLKKKSATIAFLGGGIKSVEGAGDRSAYGLPDETGVIILSAPENSLLFLSRLKPNDVIRNADEKPVNSIRDLLDIYQLSNWKGHIPVKIIRNQQEMDVELKTK
ncbi:MAG: PDZ domain-containing protein [Bacteroidetes bacterium]|nr:PDZ domain-containing protein [Bacteroidota bacterium]